MTKTPPAAKIRKTPPAARIHEVLPAAEVSSRVYGTMTLKELTGVATDLEISPLPRTKGALLTAILAAEAGSPTTIADVIEMNEKLPSIPENLLRNLGIDPISRSGRKALKFTTDAFAAGWGIEAAVQDDEETDERRTADADAVSMTFTRGDEAIDIAWESGIFDGSDCYYRHAGRTPIKLRNASECLRRMRVAPAEAAQEAAKVTAHKSARSAVRHPAQAALSLPFDPATATDGEVVAAVVGKRISWRNSISGEIEFARALGTVNIAPGTSGRSISFTDASGFRSVRVTSLVSVR